MQIEYFQMTNICLHQLELHTGICIIFFLTPVKARIPFLLSAFIVLFHIFLPTWGQRLVPRIEPLTAQFFRSNSQPSTVSLSYGNPIL